MEKKFIADTDMKLRPYKAIDGNAIQQGVNPIQLRTNPLQVPNSNKKTTAPAIQAGAVVLLYFISTCTLF